VEGLGTIVKALALAIGVVAMLWAGTASAQTVAAIPKPPQRPESKLDKDVFAKEVCGLITQNAAANGLPETFFARLIWKESLFDPGAVSPVGAQGIAQFMPGTAAIRGLQDPFDHKEALAASAQYLAFLRNKFGNLGLAAAAYNFGEEGARLYIAGKSSLPLETEDYVQFITGRAADLWKDEKTEHPIPGIGKGGDFAVECAALVKRELNPVSVPGQRGKWRPWGVVLSGGFSESRALEAFRRIKNRYGSLLGDEKPLVMRKKNLSMGTRRMVQVQVGRDSRADAEALCAKLTAAGGACMVEKN
jgi:hypothetical protein